MSLLYVVVALLAGLVIGIAIADKTGILNMFKEHETGKYSFGRSWGALLTLIYIVPAGAKMFSEGVLTMPDIPMNLALLIFGLFGLTSVAGAYLNKKG